MRFARLSLLIVLALALTGCGRRESYRYKLTLSLETPEGVKTASRVGEISFVDAVIPARGTMTDVKGEAILIDLGKDRRPLIALTSREIPLGTFKTWQHWGVSPTGVLARLHGDKYGKEDLIDVVRSLKTLKGAHEIPTEDLPDLVTFADINDPQSIVLVDPDDLESTLGPGIKWRSMTVEVTTEPVTTGIEQKLPWVKTYNPLIKVSGTGPTNNYERRLTGLDFKRER